MNDNNAQPPYSGSQRDRLPRRELDLLCRFGKPKTAPDDVGAECWLTRSWEEWREAVLARCRFELRFRPDLDPQDVCQDVFVTILKRSFAKRFDPRRGSIDALLGVIVRRACSRARRRRTCVSFDEGTNRDSGNKDEPYEGAIYNELRDALEHAGAVTLPSRSGRMPGRRRGQAEYRRTFKERQRLRHLLGRYL